MNDVKAFIIILTIVFVLLVIFYNILIWTEEKILFYPAKKHVWEPDIPYTELYINPNNFDDVLYCKTHKESQRSYVHAWHFDNFKDAKTVIFCHGNSGNISHRRYIIDICQQFRLNLIIFDYRGFGYSSGYPKKDFLKKDGEAVYKYIRSFEKSSNIIVWGESLGGVAAVWIASKYKCRSLLLLSTFSGLDDGLSYSCGENGETKTYLGTVAASLASLKIDILPNREYIRKVKCPVAIMHSKNDDMIPYQCAKILYKNVRHKFKALITIDGRHSSPIITREQLNKLFMFCDIALPEFEKGSNVQEILQDLETVAEKHNLFMED